MFSQAIVHWTSEVQNFCLTPAENLIENPDCFLLQHDRHAQTLLFDPTSGGTGGGYAQAVPSASL